MNPYYDDLERRDPQQREADLMAALSRQVAHAKASSPAQAQRLRDVDPQAVRTRQDLAALPVIRKSELLQAQIEQRGGDPFAGFAACGWNGVRQARGAKRVFQSPGPLY